MTWQREQRIAPPAKRGCRVDREPCSVAIGMGLSAALERLGATSVGEPRPEKPGFTGEAHLRRRLARRSFQALLARADRRRVPARRRAVLPLARRLDGRESRSRGPRRACRSSLRLDRGAARRRPARRAGRVRRRHGAVGIGQEHPAQPDRRSRAADERADPDRWAGALACAACGPPPARARRVRLSTAPPARKPDRVRERRGAAGRRERGAP